MTRVELRPTRPADFIALQGGPPAHRCRCLTAVVDGRVLGIGGLVRHPDGALWASVLMSADARKYPVAIHRAGLAAIAEFKRLGVKRVLAAAEGADPDVERRWLERLGFVRITIGDQEVFVWQPHP